MKRPYLLESSLFALVAIGFMIVMIKGPGWASVGGSRDYSAILKFDPPSGAVVVLPDKDLTGKRIELTEPTLLVHLGECTECTVASFDVRSLKVPLKTNVLLLVAGKSINAQAFASLPGNFHVVADRDGQLLEKLNAYWRPRAYLVDHRGVLVWLSKAPGQWPQDVSYVGK